MKGSITQSLVLFGITIVWLFQLTSANGGSTASSSPGGSTATSSPGGSTATSSPPLLDGRAPVDSVGFMAPTLKSAQTNAWETFIDLQPESEIRFKEVMRTIVKQTADETFTEESLCEDKYICNNGKIEGEGSFKYCDACKFNMGTLIKGRLEIIKYLSNYEDVKRTIQRLFKTEIPGTVVRLFLDLAKATLKSFKPEGRNPEKKLCSSMTLCNPIDHDQLRSASYPTFQDTFRGEDGSSDDN